MPRKKKIDNVVSVQEHPPVAEVPEQPKVAEPIKPKLTEVQLNKLVRVQNAGAAFPCDLTMHGYGMRWPSKAIYAIPTRKYLELLEQGFNGSPV